MKKSEDLYTSITKSIQALDLFIYIPLIFIICFYLDLNFIISFVVTGI